MSRKSNRLPPCDGWPRYLSIHQGAHALDKSPADLRKLIRQRTVRGVRLGGQDFVEAESIRDLLAVRPKRPTKPAPKPKARVSSIKALPPGERRRAIDAAKVKEAA